MDPITIALGLAQFAPSLMRMFGVGDKSATVAEKVIDIAKTVTGTDTGAQALTVLQADPKLAHEFNLAVLNANVELEKLYSAERQAAAAELTKRQQSDMTSDSWLSKNIRPLTLIFLLLNVTAIGLEWLSITENYVSMVQSFTEYALMFYFGGRTIEKVATVANTFMQAKTRKG